MSDDLEYYVDYDDHKKVVEELEGKLVWAMEYVADYSSDPHLVEWANVNLAELKGQDDE